MTWSNGFCFCNPTQKSQNFQNKTCGKGSALFPLCICSLRVFHKFQLWSNCCTRKEYSQQHIYTLKSEPILQDSTVFKKKTKQNKQKKNTTTNKKNPQTVFWWLSLSTASYSFSPAWRWDISVVFYQ